MDRSAANPWLARFSTFTALSTLLLICVGGLVTSHGAGLAVPDWPTTFGYNMFFFPIDRWVGGVLYEHSHRIVASAVGLFTVVLAAWLWIKDQRRWLRWLGVIAVVSVVVQGVLGGLRVTALKDELGIFHATLAQLFLVLLTVIAMATSGYWQTLTSGKFFVYGASSLRYFFLLTTGMILLQLILGAMMRHQHAGLAIPDFPAAYGRWWPDTSAESVARYNQLRTETTAANPITASQIVLQMVHRMVAMVILALACLSLRASWRRAGAKSPLTRFAMVWLGLLLVQAALGVATLWTNKSADVATAHVGCGALTLVLGSLLSLSCFLIAALQKPPATIRSPSSISARVMERTRTGIPV